MRHTSNEAWLFLLLVVLAIVMPFIIGLVVVKTYRRFKPIEQADTDSVSIMSSIESKDSFFKILFVGFFVSSPIFYGLYHSFLA
ncbi:hypothetical protein [Pseudoalteromonas lipolytica]|uniref:hypothetical protein n=1 Tax=Pseudoalteromonas lipolytica TaxID=570156 RepID=UPI003A97A6D0